MAPMPPSTRATIAAGLAFLAPFADDIVGDAVGGYAGLFAMGLLLAIAVWIAALLPTR